MVRVNILEPKYLTDQHLIAEYAEILMLMAYVRKYPCLGNVPKNYCLGKGHITFFKNKLLYLKKRHELLKTEMRKRGFMPKQSLDVKAMPPYLINDWQPEEKDKEIIKKRLISKIKSKPAFYRYYKSYRSLDFFIGLISKA